MDYEKLLKAFDNFKNPTSDSGMIAAPTPLLSSTALRPARPSIPPHRVAGYGRRSSANDESDSFDRQQRDIYDYSITHFGCEPGHFFFDKHVSGRTPMRPDFRKLIALIEKGELKVVVIEDIDRLGRNLALIAKFKETCDDHGVEIHSRKKNGVIDLSDIALGGYLSATQVENLRKRVMEGRFQAAKKGKVVGKMPFGYVRTANGEWVVDERYRDIIRYIFEAKRAGMHTDLISRVVGARAVMQGFPVKSFAENRVRKYLRNWKYAGLQLFGVTETRLEKPTGKYITKPAPPEAWTFAEVPEWQIVDQTTFFAVLGAMGEPKRRKIKRPRALVPNSLTVCAHCGSGLRTWKDRDRGRGAPQWILRCPERECQNSQGVPLQEVENQILNAVSTVLDDDHHRAIFCDELATQRSKVAHEQQTERANAERKIAELEAHRGILMDEVVKRVALNTTNRQRALEGLSPLPVATDNPLRHFTLEELGKQADGHDVNLQAVRLQLSHMSAAPSEIDLTKLPTLRNAYDTLIKDRKADSDRADIDLRILTDAQAAIASIVSVVKVGKLHPGRVLRFEVVVSLEDIFGGAVAQIGKARQSIITVVHPPMVHSLRGIGAIEAAATAYREKIFAATDDQFAAVVPAISARLLEMLEAASYSTREFVDLIFLITRTSIGLGFLRVAVPDRWKQIEAAVLALTESGDETWKTLFRILKNRFPQLYQEMSKTGLPKYAAAKAAVARTRASAEYRGKTRATKRKWAARPANRIREREKHKALRARAKALNTAA